MEKVGNVEKDGTVEKDQKVTSDVKTSIPDFEARKRDFDAIVSGMMRTDEVLAIAAKSGDTQAYSTLVTRGSIRCWGDVESIANRAKDVRVPSKDACGRANLSKPVANPDVSCSKR